jgi:hypothetical protein
VARATKRLTRKDEVQRYRNGRPDNEADHQRGRHRPIVLDESDVDADTVSQIYKYRDASRTGPACFLTMSVVVFALLVASCGSQRDPAISSPDEGIFFGAKAGPEQADVVGLEELLSRPLAIREIVSSWEAPWPDSRVLDDHRRGRLGLISWRGTDLATIASGQYDGMIRARARSVRALGFPIFLRPMHEMNGTWYPWCCEPERYRSVWRRIHAIFEEEGATNVAWVWSPTASVGGWSDYYPGDRYVDWIGVSVYNWGSAGPPSTWRSLSRIITPFYAGFGDGDKPIMLAEVGSAEQGGDKARWILDAAATLKARFPAVKAWIHQQYTNGDADWRVESSPQSLAAYRRIALDKYFASLPSEEMLHPTG